MTGERLTATREALRYCASYGPKTLANAVAEVEQAETRLGLYRSTVEALAESDNARLALVARVEELAPKVSCDYATETGQNCGECNDCLKVNLHFTRQAHDAAVARVEELQAALAYIEWIWDDDARVDVCLSCGKSKPSGHDRSCRTAAALSRQGDTPPVCPECGERHSRRKMIPPTIGAGSLGDAPEGETP